MRTALSISLPVTTSVDSSVGGFIPRNLFFQLSVSNLALRRADVGPLLFGIAPTTSSSSLPSVVANSLSNLFAGLAAKVPADSIIAALHRCDSVLHGCHVPRRAVGRADQD